MCACLPPLIQKKYRQHLPVVHVQDLLLGVPATACILTGDCQKISFSTLTKVPFLIFYQTNPFDAQALPN